MIDSNKDTNEKVPATTTEEFDLKEIVNEKVEAAQLEA